MATRIDMAKFAKFCKDMGFIFQSSEIYGGINGFWDYGPLGVELKRNIKEAWWQDMVRNPPPGPDGQEIRMVGLDCSIIMNPKVWVASGHVGGFSDPMVDCKKCKRAFRADQARTSLPSIRRHDSHHPVRSASRATNGVLKAAEAREADEARRGRPARYGSPSTCPRPIWSRRATYPAGLARSRARTSMRWGR